MLTDIGKEKNVHADGTRQTDCCFEKLNDENLREYTGSIKDEERKQ